MQENNTDFILFSGRIDKLANTLKLNARELADYIGISRPMLYAYKSGKSPISGKVIRKLMAAEERARQEKTSDINNTKLSEKSSQQNSDLNTNNSIIEQILAKQVEQNEILSQALTQILKQTNTVQESQAPYGVNKLEETLSELVKEIQALRKECASLKQQQNQHPPPNDGKKAAG